MTAPTQTGRPLAEALGTPVVTSEGGILTGDTAKDSAAASNGQRHSLDAVWVGITRFLADFRERQSLDAEWEFQELCGTCHQYPAAIYRQCFSCASRRPPVRLPS